MEDVKQEAAKTIRKFRVLDGTHCQGKKKFTKGQIVRSERDLVKMFAGKFVEVGVKLSEEDEQDSPQANKAKTGEGKATTGKRTT